MLRIEKPLPRELASMLYKSLNNFRNPPGTHYISETIRMANNFQTSKKDLSKENATLRSQIKSQSTANLGFEKESGIFNNA